MESNNKNKQVSIIGTGNFGRAIGTRLISFGFSVTFGIRKREARTLSALEPIFSSAVVTSVEEAIRANGIIIICIGVLNFEEFASRHKEALGGKIVVDVSNRTKRFPIQTSNAEYLQTLLPGAIVVKAFNVVSAYSMEGSCVQISRKVPVASDDGRARDLIMTIGHSIGFQPYSAGMLSASRSIEKNTMSMFVKWNAPVVTAVVVYLLWWLYVACTHFVYNNNVSWEKIFLTVSNKPLSMTAITMLSLTYLPGCITAVLHLIYDTKYHPLPKWLNSWLETRRQMGLAAFALSCMHTYVSSLPMSPAYLRHWFNGTESSSRPSDVEMNWQGELSCLTGVLTIVVLCILAVISIPGVTDSLNWAEWRFLQSKLGFLGLFLATSHVWVMGVPQWMTYSGWIEMMTSETFTSSALPLIVVLLRVFQWLPIISHRLEQIRNGSSGVYQTLTIVTSHDSQMAGNANKVTFSRLGGNKQDNTVTGKLLGSTVETPDNKLLSAQNKDELKTGEAKKEHRIADAVERLDALLNEPKATTRNQSTMSDRTDRVQGDPKRESVQSAGSSKANTTIPSVPKRQAEVTARLLGNDDSDSSEELVSLV